MIDEPEPHVVLGVAEDAGADEIAEAYAFRAAGASPGERAGIDAAYAALLAGRRKAGAVAWSLRPAALPPEPVDEAELEAAPEVEAEIEPEPEAVPEPEPEPAAEAAQPEPPEIAVDAEEAAPNEPGLTAPSFLTDSLPDLNTLSQPPAEAGPESEVEAEPSEIAAEPEPDLAPPPAPQPPAVVFTPGPPEPRTAPPRPHRGWRGLIIAGVGGVVMLLLGMLAATIISPSRPGGPNAPAPKAAPAAPVAVPAGARPLAAGSMIDWDEAKGPAHAVYAVDGLVIEISGTGGKDERHAVVKITGPGGATAEIAGEVAFEKAQVSVGAGRLNGESPAPQVLVSSFTGGAHCCVETKAAQLINGRWQVIELGQRDGDISGGFPKDIDGDGIADFTVADNRFLYAFDSYAGSWAPPQVLNLVGGQMKDVSADKRFAALFRDALPKAAAACDKGSNGACAGYVAIAARLGQTPAAWKRMLTHFDKTSDWVLPTACRRPQNATATPGGDTCPDTEEIRFASFPESLRWFLGNAGYMPAAWLPPRPGSGGPSFDCRKVSSPAQKLVCADPGLAARDRDLTALYNRALLLVPDADGVRAAQRAFLGALGGLGDDPGAVAALYDERIGVLRGQLGV